MDEKLKCLKCKWLCLDISGYSDWTVTGEWITCPSGRFSQLDKYEDTKNDGLLALAADNCPYYENGTPAEEVSLDEPNEEVAKRCEEFENKFKPRPTTEQGKESK